MERSSLEILDTAPEMKLKVNDRAFFAFTLSAHSVTTVATARTIVDA